MAVPDKASIKATVKRRRICKPTMVLLGRAIGIDAASVGRSRLDKDVGRKGDHKKRKSEQNCKAHDYSPSMAKEYHLESAPLLAER